MRIVDILTGPVAPFFEQSSQNGQALVAELRWAGHDVVLIPVLFPLINGSGSSADFETDQVPLFGGAAHIYASHCIPFLADNLPKWLWSNVCDPIFRRHLAKYILKSPERFGNFILDALNGENGRLSKEIDALCDWLAEKTPSDIILFSSPLLLGIAPMIKQRSGIPVTCYMSTELEDLPHIGAARRTAVLAKMRSLIREADGFISISHFHARRIHKNFGAPISYIKTVHPGIELDSVSVRSLPESRIAGFVVREHSGEELRNACGVLNTLSPLLKKKDIKPYLIMEADTSAKKVSTSVLNNALNLFAAAGGEIIRFTGIRSSMRKIFSRASMLIFIHSEPLPAFDMRILEAMACGVPVVVPNNGANGEIAALSNGVLLYDNYKSAALTAALDIISSDANLLNMSNEARHSIELYFSMPQTAKRVVEVLESIKNRVSPKLKAVQSKPKRNPESKYTTQKNLYKKF